MYLTSAYFTVRLNKCWVTSCDQKSSLKIKVQQIIKKNYKALLLEGGGLDK